jgi:hypothetical protein
MISHESLFIFLPARVIAANTKPMRKNECIVIGWCCGVLVSWCALIGIKLKLRISDGMSEEKGNPKKSVLYENYSSHRQSRGRPPLIRRRVTCDGYPTSLGSHFRF